MKPGSGTQSAPGRDPAADPSYRTLDAQHIVDTLVRLGHRIDDRFPESGLSKVCRELVALAHVAGARSAEIGRPIWALRVVAVLAVIAILGASGALLWFTDAPQRAIDAAELVSLLEAGINDVVLIGAAVFFLWSLELRIRRGRALNALHELRSIAHIIDMHQLTKDPERALHRGPDTVSSPTRTLTPFLLSRYLDYCSEMLSLNGKLAALYMQEFNDSVVLASVNELETLCTGLCRKIWQKITLLEELRDENPPGRDEADEADKPEP